MTPEQYIEKYKTSAEEWGPNKNCLEDIACPKCGYRDRFIIQATSSFIMQDEGTSEFGDVEYDDNNYIACDSCGQDGKVSEFKIEGLDAALNKYIVEVYNWDVDKKIEKHIQENHNFE